MENNFDQNNAKKLIEELNLSLDNQQIERLFAYVKLLYQWNRVYNLTAVRNPNHMWVKHILDSLASLPYLQGNRFIDVGTGAGLPGMVLAIASPHQHFTLLDSLGKRISFVKQVALTLGVDNVSIVQARVQDFTQQCFDGVLSRAFADIADMYRWCQHLVPQGGYFYALKGGFDESEQSHLTSLNPQISLKKITLNIPTLQAERSLVIVQKP